MKVVGKKRRSAQQLRKVLWVQVWENFTVWTRHSGFKGLILFPRLIYIYEIDEKKIELRCKLNVSEFEVTQKKKCLLNSGTIDDICRDESVLVWMIKLTKATRWNLLVLLKNWAEFQ